MMHKKYKRLAWLLLFVLIVSLNLTQLTTASAATAADAIYFQDDFSDGDYTTNPVWTTASGTWNVITDPTDSSNKVLNQTDTGEGIITAGDSTWTDYAVSMRFYTGAGNAWPGILARVQDSRNFYYFQMQKTTGLTLTKRINGTDNTLKSVSYPMKPNTWYQLKMALVGSSIKCYIVDNGIDKLLFDVTDSTYTTGKIGIRNKWDTISLDDVLLTGAPAANNSVLQSPSQTGTSISLNWTPVDGATSYNIYRSKRKNTTGMANIIKEHGLRRE